MFMEEERYRQDSRALLKGSSRAFEALKRMNNLGQSKVLIRHEKCCQLKTESFTVEENIQIQMINCIRTEEQNKVEQKCKQHNNSSK